MAVFTQNDDESPNGENGAHTQGNDSNSSTGIDNQSASGVGETNANTGGRLLYDEILKEEDESMDANAAASSSGELTSSRGNAKNSNDNRRWNRRNRRHHESEKEIIPNKFVVYFQENVISLKDPKVRAVLDVLSQAKSVKANGLICVGCESEEVSESFKKNLEEHPEIKNYSFRPFYKKIEKIEPQENVMYAVGLPHSSTLNDFLGASMNKFKRTGIKLVNTYPMVLRNRTHRVGRIYFLNEDDYATAVNQRTMHVCGKAVQLYSSKAAARSAIQKRLWGGGSRKKYNYNPHSRW